MGKRKYDDEKSHKYKKSKDLETGNTDGEQPQTVEKSDERTKTQIPHAFDVKHFRKELAGKQEQTMVLTQFLQVCLNPDNEVDYLLEYLKCGGNSHEILRQITQDSRKNLTLATPAFHIFHLIIVKVQSSLPHMITITEEACRYFLNTFMSTVEIMISENSGPKHRKIVLKLLTSMVTLNSDLGIEVLNQAPLTPKHLHHIVEKPNYKEKDNVRTSFVHFMTSFLVEGHLPLIKALLEKQGLLGLLIPGLIHDEAQAVLMFLNILKNNVIDNALISKSLKLKTFSHQVLHHMFKIFSWKGPPEMGMEARKEMKMEISHLLSDILLTLFTNHKIGLYFMDSTLGTGDANKNPNLYKALSTLKRPWEIEAECEVILQIIYKCPDLHRAIINVIEQSFEPQHSPIWERTTEFTLKLISQMKPEEMINRMSNLMPIQVANFIRFTTLPIPLLKCIQNSLSKDQTISLYCVKVLVKMLQALRRYVQILELNDSSSVLDLKNRLEYFLPKHLPVPTAIVTLIDNVVTVMEQPTSTQDYKLPAVNKTDALISLIDLLLLYHDIHPVFFETLEGSIDMKKILDYSVTLVEGPISLLKFKVVSLWLTLDSSAVSLKNTMFKDLFLIMLEVYMSDDDNTWVEAKDTLHVFFKNMPIFENDEDEIHLILYTLRNAKINPPSIISDIVEYVLKNYKELSESVRNQLVNFEISDVNRTSLLDKLFDDLMENRHTDDNVFLENKVLSPFIVGCMQYLQSNKHFKKNMKPFLSLYFVNLLHSNYSPALTEVLIGESKLDARTYVVCWKEEPAALPETISGCDNVMTNISKAIVENEDISLTSIFPFIEECIDENDFTLNSVSYKFDVSRNIDSSDLLIWAKYLIFCLVRLTDMAQLTDERQTKITDFFQCLMAISRKIHKVDVCRNILMNLFKNPHILKIYKPLDSNKGSGLLATKFILQVVIDHKDIINCLNEKHKILKSYQQKNYNEIVKAFTKISRKKNVSSDHTMKVLTIVGLAKEDDMRVFNQIFSTEVANCVRDDKEPSLVLELLKNLIDKYSNVVNLELEPQILRKCMKLYTELLTNKEMNPNLSCLEESLARYFENKPHQTNKISEDLFKKFGDAHIVRKTTSYFAHVLLKNNIRFCNAFKEMVTKPEILSHRELTLPLGSAVVNHKPFFLENKPLLADIYNEYKSNISKLLEKPHKAGQVYTTNSIFIRKLILECMDIKECEKLFSKSHKFESVELSHVHLLHTVFLKLCISENVKKDNIANYLLSMLHLAVIALKEGKEMEVLKEIVVDIYGAVQIIKTLEAFTKINDGFGKITESAIWQNFAKVVLKDSLKIKTVDQNFSLGPQFLCLLTNLVKLFYPHDHEDISNLFDMVTSHSEFLNVMLSHHSSEIKSRLLEFLYTLVTMNRSAMKTQQIPVYLSSYHATRSPCDRLILAILYHYETSGLPVNEYKPYVWGDSGANYYAVRKNRASSLWSQPTPNRVLSLFEKDAIERTVRNFPVTQKLDYHYELPSNIVEVDGHSVKRVFDSMSEDGVSRSAVVKDTEEAVKRAVLKGKYKAILEDLRARDVASESHADGDEGVYDPLFVLPLLGQLLAPGGGAEGAGGAGGAGGRLLRAGLLSVPLAGLSARCPGLRAAAAHVLHRCCLLLHSDPRHKNDRLFLNDFMSTLRNSLSSALNDGGASQPDPYSTKNPRLPAVNALYLARALMVCTAPFDPLYKPVNNFLIAKQFVDLSVVPDFLSLFHDSDVEAAERRIWILDVIRDGTKTMSDVNVIFKTMCIKMILDYYSSVLSDRRTKERILTVVNALVSIPRALEILAEGYGLLSWLHGVGRQTGRDEKSIVKALWNVIKNIILSMKLNSFTKHVAVRNGKVNDFVELKLNKDMESEILTILYDSLRNTDGLEAEDVVVYLKVYNLLTKRTLKLLTKDQLVNLVYTAGKVCKEIDIIQFLIKAIMSNNISMLNSKLLSFNSGSCNSLLAELTAIVRSYLV